MVALENKSSVYLSFRLAGIIFFKTTNKCLICDIIDSHNRKMCTSQERQKTPNARFIKSNVCKWANKKQSSY